MEKCITGLLMKDNEATVVQVGNDLESLYELLGCDTVEAPEIKISGTYYDCICDEEGRMVEDPVPTVLLPTEKGFYPHIVGACLICNWDEEGEWASLTDADIAILKAHVYTGTTPDGNRIKFIMEDEEEDKDIS